jgi:hypothetical protein
MSPTVGHTGHMHRLFADGVSSSLQQSSSGYGEPANKSYLKNYIKIYQSLMSNKFYWIY